MALSCETQHLSYQYYHLILTSLVLRLTGYLGANLPGLTLGGFERLDGLFWRITSR